MEAASLLPETSIGKIIIYIDCHQSKLCAQLAKIRVDSSPTQRMPLFSVADIKEQVEYPSEVQYPKSPIHYLASSLVKKLKRQYFSLTAGGIECFVNPPS